MVQAFEVICEIEPATRPDLRHVRHQIGVLSRIASGFLIPDNHLGRATVSSIAVAHEVGLMGGRAIACLNARDRNLLGFRRDLLTAAAYGVEEFLLVFGDRPSSGESTGHLTVRSMLAELRAQADTPPFGPMAGSFRAGVTTRLTPLPAWKQDADFLFVQVSFSRDGLLRWRESLTFEGPIFAGVIVPTSAPMALKLAANVADIDVPPEWLEALVRDPAAGVHLARDLVLGLRDSGGFDGVHLVPVARYREIAAELERAFG